MATQDGPTSSGRDTPEDSIKTREVEQSWAEFLKVRSGLAEVMSDADLYDFGFNLDVLDAPPW